MMLDNEKDEIIKKALHKDNYISDRANDVFKNFEMKILASESSRNIEEPEEVKREPKNVEKIEKKQTGAKIYNFFRIVRNYTAVAASVAVAVFIGAGAAVWTSNDNKNNTPDNTNEVSQSWAVGINGGGTAGDYTTAEIKNEEVDANSKENLVKTTHENKYVKAVLYKDGSVAVQLKQALVDFYKLSKIDSSKTYKVSGVSENVKDIFVGSLYSEQFVYVFLITNDNTVEVVPILDGEIVPSKSNGYTFKIENYGKIKGLKDVSSFEQGVEPVYNEDELRYYIYAITNDNRRILVDDIEQVDMSLLGTKYTYNGTGNMKYTEYVYNNYSAGPNSYIGTPARAYFISNQCLYVINLTNGKTTKLATGVNYLKDNLDGTVLVRTNTVNTIHVADNTVKYMEYSVTDAAVKEKEEDENFIVSLKEDGSMTIELKEGAIKRLGAQEFFKEGFVYNFYAAGYSEYSINKYTGTIKEKQKGNYYTNAQAFYLGKIGSKNDVCVAYVNQDNKYVVIDLTKFVKESISGFFTSEPGNEWFIVDSGTASQKISKIIELENEVRLQNGNIINCKTIAFMNLNNSIVHSIDLDNLLRLEGLGNFTIL